MHWSRRGSERGNPSSLQLPVLLGLNSTSFLFHTGTDWKAVLELLCRMTYLLTPCEVNTRCHVLTYWTNPV